VSDFTGNGMLSTSFSQLGAVEQPASDWRQRSQRGDGNRSSRRGGGRGASSSAIAHAHSKADAKSSLSYPLADGNPNQNADCNENISRLGYSYAEAPFDCSTPGGEFGTVKIIGLWHIRLLFQTIS
jgi:hypothetical protein